MKLLKNVIIYIFNIIGLLISLKPFLFILKVIKWCLNQFYSGWIRGQLKSVSGSFNVKFPQHLLNGHNVEIGENFIGGRRLRIETFDNFQNFNFSPCLKIGNNVIINDDCHIGCINSIKIGDNVLFASKVFICDHFHGDVNGKDIDLPPNERKLISKGEVIIGNNVWIGEGVCIMPNVTIGDNSIIGANSVVTKNCLPNSVIAGNPAKTIRLLK